MTKEQAIEILKESIDAVAFNYSDATAERLTALALAIKTLHELGGLE